MNHFAPNPSRLLPLCSRKRSSCLCDTDLNVRVFVSHNKRVSGADDPASCGGGADGIPLRTPDATNVITPTPTARRRTDGSVYPTNSFAVTLD